MNVIYLTEEEFQNSKARMAETDKIDGYLKLIQPLYEAVRKFQPDALLLYCVSPSVENPCFYRLHVGLIREGVTFVLHQSYKDKKCYFEVETSMFSEAKGKHPAPTERGKPRTQPDRSFHQTENRGLDNVGIENLQGVGSRERSYPTDESRVFRQTQQRANRMEGHRKAYRGQNQAERACFLLPYMRTQAFTRKSSCPCLTTKAITTRSHGWRTTDLH
ncbi:hypothetical protein NXW76_20615 [Bacteroides thetaiotaomicron]|nr:hypothetical protein [Bacteroides thetaiotaomicron]